LDELEDSLTAYIEFRTKTVDRLDNIENLLTKQTLASHAELLLADFKLTLPNLASTMARAKQEHIKVSPEVISTILVCRAELADSALCFWEFILTNVGHGYGPLGLRGRPEQRIVSTTPNRRSSRRTTNSLA
jgi:hypothetical protein